MHRKSVLIVEDDDAIRETLRLALSVEGYTAFGAKDGRDGIEILRKLDSPGLILLDLMMPVMNGWEFMEVMNSDDRLTGIPVVILTAFTDKATSIKSQGIIKKPIDLNLLMNFVEKTCG